MIRITAGAALLAAMIGTPASAQSRAQSSTANVDARAVAVLRSADSALAALNAVSVSFTVHEWYKTILEQIHVGTVAVRRGATGSGDVRASVLRTFWGSHKGSQIEIRTTWLETDSTDARTRTCRNVSLQVPCRPFPDFAESKTKSAPSIPDVPAFAIAGFFAAAERQDLPVTHLGIPELDTSELRSLRLLPTEQWKGKSYTVVEWTYKRGLQEPRYDITYAARIFVGSDKLVHRIVTTGGPFRIVQEVTKIDLAPPAAAFAYEAPAGLGPPPAVQSAPGQGSAPVNTVTLRPGDAAPAFTLRPAIDSPTVSLSTLLSGRKAVVLAFGGIAQGGAPIAMHEHDPAFRGRAEYPRLQRLSDEIRTKGAYVLGILEPPFYDLRHQLAAFLRHNKFTLPLLYEDYKARGATCAAYGCTPERWIFVLDGGGRVVYAGGFDERKVRAELERLGVK